MVIALQDLTPYCYGPCQLFEKQQTCDFSNNGLETLRIKVEKTFNYDC